MDGNKNGNEFIFSDTLADIDNQDCDDDDDDDDAIEPLEMKQTTVPLKDLPVTKETVDEQQSWLNVSVDDI